MQSAGEPTFEEQEKFRASGESTDGCMVAIRWPGCSRNAVSAISRSAPPVSHAFLDSTSYLLDCEEDGSTRKPDSLSMEE